MKFVEVHCSLALRLEEFVRNEDVNNSESWRLNVVVLLRNSVRGIQRCQFAGKTQETGYFIL
ncbi:hypothetical protein, partial [Enterococcus faecium]|uniref:hypothetical protein n=1 Tax=Enterococcus faecium TaxID=1352 RepID=UPI003F43822A